jgi:S1-C subfamily serine protease
MSQFNFSGYLRRVTQRLSKLALQQPVVTITRTLRHHFKEITVALVLAVIAAVLIDLYRDRVRFKALQNNLKAVATLRVYDQQHKVVALGSGFFITSDGLLATAFHIIKGSADVVARLPSGAFYAFKGLRDVDEKADIAILQFDARETPAVTGLGDSDILRIGDQVYAIVRRLA